MILEFLQGLSVLLLAVVVHECAHGFVADKLGDPTARLSGRLTLNPIKHIDPIGSILLPFIMTKMGFYPFGWAKPVPVNFRNLRNPKRDMMLVALAGPGINLVMAGVLSLFLHLPLPHFLFRFIESAIMINLALAVFNMLPVPPLDGSRILMGLLPDSLGRLYSQLEPFGIIIVIFLLNFNALGFIWDGVEFLAHLLGIPIRII